MRQRNHPVWQPAIQGTRDLFQATSNHLVLTGSGIFLLESCLTIGLASDSHLPLLSPPEMGFDEESNADRTTLFVKGKILDIVDERIVIVEGMDGPVELRLTVDTIF